MAADIFNYWCGKIGIHQILLFVATREVITPWLPCQIRQGFGLLPSQKHFFKKYIRMADKTFLTTNAH